MKQKFVIVAASAAFTGCKPHEPADSEEASLKTVIHEAPIDVDGRFSSFSLPYFEKSFPAGAPVEKRHEGVNHCLNKGHWRACMLEKGGCNQDTFDGSDDNAQLFSSVGDQRCSKFLLSRADPPAEMMLGRAAERPETLKSCGDCVFEQYLGYRRSKPGGVCQHKCGYYSDVCNTAGFSHSGSSNQVSPAVCRIDCAVAVGNSFKEYENKLGAASPAEAYEDCIKCLCMK
jgi:hypothetical protein